MKVLLTSTNSIKSRALEDDLRSRENVEIVGIVRDGWTCLEYVERYQPDIVLLEMTMPRLDGLGVLDRMRDFEVRPKIIVMTGVTNEQVIMRCMRKGAEDVMIKPLEPDVVYDRMVEICTEPQVQEGTYSYVGKRFVPREESNAMKVTKLLREMGFQVNLHGYMYLRDALVLCIEDFSRVANVGKRLYPLVAEKYGTTGDRVERDIRHAINSTWTRGNQDFMAEYLGSQNVVKTGRITTSEFISVVADKMRLERI